MNTTERTSTNRTARRAGVAAAAAAVAAGAAVVGFGGGPAAAIVDGEDTTASENPWQVALVDGEGQFCGGSLISDRIVVTAAHCVVGMPEGQITVRAGVTDIAGSGGQSRGVTGVVEHQRYAETGTADIAMLVLDRPFESSADIAPIPVATASELANATTARVTGWGVLGETTEASPDRLQSADVPIVDDAACSADLGTDPEDELCAGGQGQDSCYGDSGGPLTIDTPRGRVLAGVVSWGEECGGPAPGVYAEVPNFASWIDERVSNPDAPTPDRLPADAGEFDDWGEGEFDEFEDGSWDDGAWDDEFGDIEFDDGEFDEAGWDDEFADGEFDDAAWDDGAWDDEFADGEFDDAGWDDEFADGEFDDEFGGQLGEDEFGDAGWCDDEHLD